ncbi:Hypothetical predicted protein [Cloeon dipterum]|uniref:poly(ADP-ribose) glycohydrolase n=1 Tax=Cloeon dipterum TaxID=197152 RepID=A0A8S1CND2_9INSE|nr:Hypothetical predicted protein [Cloeon dipterum]
MEFTKEKISQILANAFCGRFRGLASNVNFDRLFAHGHRDPTKIEKLKCLMYYFNKVTATKSGISSMSEKVTFKRIVTREAPKWHSSRAYLSEFAINTKDSMFDCPGHMAEVDFANKRIGGGVLGNGCVQEEIKFITCPELIVAKAFCDDLRINEALIMTGATPFSAFTGYASTFKHAGGARKPEESKVVIAIDAMDFSRIDSKMQFKKECIDRELLKAYTGFVHCPKNWIATGNWGCGAFRGDPELKMKIQWIAASMANKKLCYFSYNDSNLKETFEKVQNTFSGMRIGEAYNLLLSNDSNIVKRLMKLIFWAFFAFSVAANMWRSSWLGGSSANRPSVVRTGASLATTVEDHLRCAEANYEVQNSYAYLPEMGSTANKQHDYLASSQPINQRERLDPYVSSYEHQIKKRNKGKRLSLIKVRFKSLTPLSPLRIASTTSAGNMSGQLKNWDSFESFDQLELFIKSRVPSCIRESFENLNRAISEFSHPNVLGDLVPKILRLAKEASAERIEAYVQRRGANEFFMTKRDIARMMANGFFCNFANPGEPLNFCRLYCSASGGENSKVEKLKCLLEYFRQVTSRNLSPNLDELVKFKLCRVERIPKWEECGEKMGKFVFEMSNMFDCSKELAQVDFANKSIGGGVMSNGCVQEEIKFITCPELIVSAMIFKNDMADNEAIVIEGAAPYAKYTGYAKSFKYAGPVTDQEKEIRSKTIIAIDAINFYESGFHGPKHQQYSQKAVDRELLKACVGFSNCPAQMNIATGNWGCGAFGGDIELKMCIQWLAATYAGKELYYFGYSDKLLCKAYDDLLSSFNFLTLGEVYKQIVSLCDMKSKYYPNHSIVEILNEIRRAQQMASAQNTYQANSSQLESAEDVLESFELITDDETGNYPSRQLYPNLPGTTAQIDPSTLLQPNQEYNIARNMQTPPSTPSDSHQGNQWHSQGSNLGGGVNDLVSRYNKKDNQRYPC